MRFHRLKLTALVLAGYLIFCCLGVLPKYMSLVKFPSSIQRYNTAYTYVGYTYDDKFSEEVDKPVIRKGTFDELFLFRNGNLRNGGYFDENKNVFNLNTNTEAVKFTTKNKLKTIVKTEVSGENSVVLKAGKYYFSLRKETGSIRVIMNKKYSRGFRFSEDDFLNSEDTLDYERFLDLLKKQREEKITLREFAYLLKLTMDEVLVYYNKDSKIVVFKEMVDDEHYMFVTYNMEDNSVTKTKTYKKHEHEFLVYYNVLLYYDEATKTIRLRFLDSDSETTIVTDVEKLSFMNYRVYEDGTLVYCYVSDNRLVWKFPEKKVEAEFGYHNIDLKDGETLLIGDEKALFYKKKEKTQITYVYVDVPGYTRTEE